LKVYPNPMTDKSILEILPPLAGDAIISVCDMTGKVVTQFKGYVENYIQEFSLSGIKNGLHVINVQGNGYQFSEKLLSNGKSNGTAIIARVSNNIQAVAEKKLIRDSKGVQATVDMAYNTGERLKYTAVSGNNSTVMTDIPTADNTITFTFTECKDGDNNYYPVVTINTQVWMAENLKYLPSVVVSATGSETVPYYYVYGYDGTVVADAKAKADYTTYGVLYNWPAAMNSATSSASNPSGVQGVCPTGWHLPSDAEWTELTNNFGGEIVAGDKLKETGPTHWINPNTGTNESGFTALPSGYRSKFGAFGLNEFGSFWWSTTEHEDFTFIVYYRSLVYDHSDIYREGDSKDSGFSIRCVKNN
jgi:uncharacterized protein (TIGR02145 family)